MQRTRPTSVTIIAILNLVFGGLWLLCALGSLGMQASGMQQMFANMGSINPRNDPKLAKQEEIRKEMMEFSQKTGSRPSQYASLLQYIVLAILLIISGIGLLKTAPWGRALALVYAALSILSNLGLIVLVLLTDIPTVQEFAEKLATQGEEAQMLANLMKFFAYVPVVVLLLSLIYPAIVAILMLRPSVAAAFRGETPLKVEGAPASEHIEEDDRWGRG